MFLLQVNEFDYIKGFQLNIAHHVQRQQEKMTGLRKVLAIFKINKEQIFRLDKRFL